MDRSGRDRVGEAQWLDVFFFFLRSSNGFFVLEKMERKNIIELNVPLLFFWKYLGFVYDIYIYIYYIYNIMLYNMYIFYIFIHIMYVYMIYMLISVFF